MVRQFPIYIFKHILMEGCHIKWCHFGATDIAVFVFNGNVIARFQLSQMENLDLITVISDFLSVLIKPDLRHIITTAVHEIIACMIRSKAQHKTHRSRCICCEADLIILIADFRRITRHTDHRILVLEESAIASHVICQCILRDHCRVTALIPVLDIVAHRKSNRGRVWILIDGYIIHRFFIIIIKIIQISRSFQQIPDIKDCICKWRIATIQKFICACIKSKLAHRGDNRSHNR